MYVRAQGYHPAGDRADLWAHQPTRRAVHALPRARVLPAGKHLTAGLSESCESIYLLNGQPFLIIPRLAFCLPLTPIPFCSVVSRFTMSRSRTCCARSGTTWPSERIRSGTPPRIIDPKDSEKKAVCFSHRLVSFPTLPCLHSRPARLLSPLSPRAAVACLWRA